MIEAEREGAFDVERAAKAHAAVDPERRAPRQRQVQRREEVLVPAHGDAVFGDAAEAGEGPLVERHAELAPALHGARRPRVGAQQIRAQRLDLEAVDAYDAEAVVEQVLAERVPRGTEADDEHVAAAVGQREGSRAVERVPAREEAVDLEAPRQPQHLREHAGLGLGNVDRLLLLEDAPLHAVVADAVARAGDHRVVNDDDRERPDRVAAFPQDVHLADLLVERAARERDAQRVALERAMLVVHALRARVLLALVAVHAVVGLVRDLARGHARVRERKPVAPAAVLGRPVGDVRQLRVGPAQRHELVVVHVVRHLERDPTLDGGAPRRLEAMHGRPALEQVDPIRELLGSVTLALAGQQHGQDRRERQLVVARRDELREGRRAQRAHLRAQRRRALGRRRRLRVLLDGAPRDEGLHPEDDVLARRPIDERLVLLLDTKEPRHEGPERPRHGDEQLRLLRRREHLSRPIRLELLRELRVRRRQLRPKPRIQLGELRRLVQIPVAKPLEPQPKIPLRALRSAPFSSREREPFKHVGAISYNESGRLG